MRPGMPLVRLDAIQVMAFDLDDTLYPERSFAFSGFEAVAGWLRGRMDCPCDPAARMRELFETGHRGHIFNKVLEESGCPEAEAWLPEMIHLYRTHAPAIQLHPDADRAMRRWSGPLRLVLISDGPLIMQQRKVAALGLAGRLDHIILTDEWGPQYWKPHPRAFELVEQTCGCHGPACVYLADNPAKDFVAPRQLGWRTIHVRRAGGVYAAAESAADGAPEYQVASLDEVDITSA